MLCLRLPALALVTSLAGALPLTAQTLNVRPALFADPVPGNDSRRGEVVLGETTLASALRIFAVELEEDSVRLPLSHGANPAVLRGTGVSLGSGASQPQYRLELGPQRYTLYFDGNERLIGVRADRAQLPRALHRENLAGHYPTLRLQYGAGSALNWLAAPLGKCVSAIATTFEGEDGLRDSRHLVPGTVVEFGYIYRCPTRPAPTKANLPQQ